MQIRKHMLRLRYHSSNSPLKSSYQMGECVCLVLVGQKYIEEQLQQTHQVVVVVERQQFIWGREGVWG